MPLYARARSNPEPPKRVVNGFSAFIRQRTQILTLPFVFPCF